MKSLRSLAAWLLVTTISITMAGLVALALKAGPSNLLGRIAVAIALSRAKSAPSGPPSDIFRQFVVDPIPESVTEIKVDQTLALFGYGYTLRFKISRPDLALIINSRAFKRVSNIRYDKKDTFLNWTWDTGPGAAMFVYARGKHRPSWFMPETLVNTEAYAIPVGAGDTRVLLYGEKEGEAYLIILGG
jgi:hypothetical protein